MGENPSAFGEDFSKLAVPWRTAAYGFGDDEVHKEVDIPGAVG